MKRITDKNTQILTPLNVVGVMTGNSMDAVDVVLTKFYASGQIEDILFHSLPYDPGLYNALSALRKAVNACGGDLCHIEKTFTFNGQDFNAIQTNYITLVAKAIKELCNLAGTHGHSVDLIGNHGQTLAHAPPSITGTKDTSSLYTVQIGDGQALSNLTGVAVVFDFRSDDLMQGGEAAPLAPSHHRAIAQSLKKDGHFPVIFCNAGNTANISVITRDPETASDYTIGWDTGPFNYFPDQLMRRYQDKNCDYDGLVGKVGSVDIDLLDLLFESAVVDDTGHNYLSMPPPKSSDGEWYKFLYQLTDGGSSLSFADRVRTAEYFSVYTLFHSLGYIDQDIEMPNVFALAGGGWKNPIMRMHFEALISGDQQVSPILQRHQQMFAAIRGRLDPNVKIDLSEKFGFDSDAMEARIFAHMAVAYIQKVPFTTPQLTGCRHAVPCGIIAFPEFDANNASDTLKAWLHHYNHTPSAIHNVETRWSRAASGWHNDDTPKTA